MVSHSHSWLARLGRPAAAGLAVVAACLVVCLVQAVSAQPSVSVSADASGDKILITPAQLSGDTYGLYLVDCARGTVCLYQYVPRDRVLNLVAARRYSFDVQSQGSARREGERER